MKKHALIANPIHILVLLCTCTLLLAKPAQAQDNSLFSHVPPDAGSLTRIDVGSITTKMGGWDDLIKNIPLQMLKLGNYEKFLTDPSSAGLDIHGQVLIATTSYKNADSSTYSTIIFPITDSAKFREFVHQVFPDDRIRRNPDKSFSIFHKGATTSWNDKLVVRVEVKAPMKGLDDKWDWKDDKAGVKPPPPSYAATHTRSLMALKGFGTSFYTTDPAFKQRFSDGADVQSCYEHGGYMQKFSKMIPKASKLGINLDKFDIYAKKYSEVRFENGRMVVDGLTILKPDMAALISKANIPPFNPDIIARLPKGDLLGFVNIRFDKSVAGEFLDKFGFKKLADSIFRQIGIDPSDLANAIKPDLTVAVIGGDAKNEKGKPKPDIYFIAPVDDMTALHHLGQSLMKIAAQDSAKADTSSHHKKNMTAEFVHHSVVQDGLLVISGSKEQSEAYFKSEKRNPDMIPADLRQSPSFVWIDFHAVINYIGRATGDDPNAGKTRMILDKLGVLDKFIISGNFAQNGEIRSKIELTTNHPDENILKTIVNLIH